MDYQTEKQKIRREARSRRNSLSETEQNEYSKRIIEQLISQPEFQTAETIFCYISYLSEVQTHGLIQEYLLGKKRVCVPKIMSETLMIAVEITEWNNLKPDQYGIPTPISDEEAKLEYDLCIAPGLAFTKTGHRMGYGRGYYDRWLARNKVKHTIALAYECQFVDEMPVEETDIAMDKILTEKK